MQRKVLTCEAGILTVMVSPSCNLGETQNHHGDGPMGMLQVGGYLD